LSEKCFNDPLSLEELTVKVIELDERVTRLETLVEEFRKTREELKAEIRELREELKGEIKAEVNRLDAEIRELRMVMIGGFIAVIAVSILLKLLLG
jgi:archaellum component FlaC